ncbi:30S ribosomal protein S6 [Tumidithrix elongata RA019]|uniref:Small ribosomal subunit protein bS6 n=1 Tax=Tumidithrix elongata BACA0141 TaxID=2716417 RepID=A0AAW9Q301_9CYAN|nr:30S ribosomal protein S6 [Tumidithrix elongata RA019]
MKRLYETMYILRPDLNDQDTDAAIAKYQTILQNNGAEPITIQHRGKRRLAYDIKKHREGIYVQMNYSAEPRTVEEMEKVMRLGEEVIRYLTIKLDPEAIVDVALPDDVPAVVAAPVIAEAVAAAE